MSSFADRVSNIRPEGAYQVLAQAQELERQGRDIIHLEIGQPDFQTFDPICESGRRAIEEGHTRYTPSAGMRELREALAEHISATKGPCAPSEVVVGPGAKPGILFPILALVNPGDEVLYPDPGFPSYRADIELAGGVPVPAPLLERRNFSFDLDFLADHMGDRTKLIILNSPSNPTGGTIPREDLEAIAKLAIERDVWVMTDEIYGDLVYDDQTAPSFWSIEAARHRTILVDGFSKSFAMTGWRLGYAAMPKALADKVALLTMHAVGCTAGFTQVAGVTALEQCRAAVNAQRAIYQQRRDRIVAGLASLPGVSCVKPSGAFYAFPNVTGLGIPSAELARRLLNDAGVACLPGTDFGEHGEGYLRFSYAASLEAIGEAVERIAAFIAKHPRPSRP
ncbi:MAG TPA: pyridoxal phosphate-dependent aminotransferase [Polyangiaceae bacterium]|nr:pyridoxal phosphate-dependent aminotransferase [Polyangiaceae bacterium]